MPNCEQIENIFSEEAFDLETQEVLNKYLETGTEVRNRLYIIHRNLPKTKILNFYQIEYRTWVCQVFTISYSNYKASKTLWTLSIENILQTLSKN